MRRHNQITWRPPGRRTVLLLAGWGRQSREEVSKGGNSLCFNSVLRREAALTKTGDLDLHPLPALLGDFSLHFFNRLCRHFLQISFFGVDTVMLQGWTWVLLWILRNSSEESWSLQPGETLNLSAPYLHFDCCLKCPIESNRWFIQAVYCIHWSETKCLCLFPVFQVKLHWPAWLQPHIKLTDRTIVPLYNYTSITQFNFGNKYKQKKSDSYNPVYLVTYSTSKKFGYTLSF